MTCHKNLHLIYRRSTRAQVTAWRDARSLTHAWYRMRTPRECTVYGYGGRAEDRVDVLVVVHGYGDKHGSDQVSLELQRKHFDHDRLREGSCCGACRHLALPKVTHTCQAIIVTTTNRTDRVGSGLSCSA